MLYREACAAHIRIEYSATLRYPLCAQLFKLREARIQTQGSLPIFMLKDIGVVDLLKDTP
jgi:hypothetical protein